MSQHSNRKSSSIQHIQNECWNLLEVWSSSKNDFSSRCWNIEIFNYSWIRRETSMKLFEIVQDNFALLGISPSQPRFNSKSAMVFLSIGLAAISCAMFLFFEANTFMEYINTAYATSVTIGGTIAFTTLLFEKEKLLQIIHEFEEFVNESQFSQRTIFFIYHIISNIENEKYACLFQNPKIIHLQKQSMTKPFDFSTDCVRSDSS